MRFGSHVGLLKKVQRLCCLGISGAKRNASTRAIATIRAIRPIEIQVKYEAASAMIWLRTTGEWENNGHITGHRTILDHNNNEIFIYNKCLQYNKNFNYNLFNVFVKKRK